MLNFFFQILEIISYFGHMQFFALHKSSSINIC